MNQLRSRLARAVNDHRRPNRRPAKSPPQKAAQQQPTTADQGDQHQPANQPGRTRHQPFTQEHPHRHQQQDAGADTQDNGVQQAFIGIAQDGPVQTDQGESSDQGDDGQRKQPDHLLQHIGPPLAQANGERGPHCNQHRQRVADHQQQSPGQRGKVKQRFEFHWADPVIGRRSSQATAIINRP